MRSIDLQDNMSKAPLASREQQIQQSNADQGQRQVAIRLDEEHAHDQTRPVPTERMDGPENRVDRETDDGRRQQQSQRHGGRSGPGNAEGDASASPGVSPNSRDIDVVG